MQLGTLWHSKAEHGLNLQASAANLHIVEILWDAVGHLYNSYGIQGLESRSGPCIFIPQSTTVYWWEDSAKTINVLAEINVLVGRFVKNSKSTVRNNSPNQHTIDKLHDLRIE